MAALLWQGLCAQANAPVRNFREACERGTPAEIEFFLKNGAEVNLPFEGDDLEADGLFYEITPLSAAAKKNSNPDSLRLLIDHGASVNADIAKHGKNAEMRPLSYAAAYNDNPAVAATLIASGADVNAGAALERAARQNANPAVFRRLFEAGVYVRTPSFFIFEAAKNPNPKVLQTAIECLGGVDAADADGSSALFRAAMPGGQPEVAAALLRAGAAVNRVNAQGWTPLALAVMYRNVPVARLFLENGGDPAVKSVDELGVWGLLGKYDGKLDEKSEALKALFEERKVPKVVDLASIPTEERLIRSHKFEGTLSPYYRGTENAVSWVGVVYRGTPEELKKAAEQLQKEDEAHRRRAERQQKANAANAPAPSMPPVQSPAK